MVKKRTSPGFNLNLGILVLIIWPSTLKLILETRAYYGSFSFYVIVKTFLLVTLFCLCNRLGDVFSESKPKISFKFIIK